MYKIDRRGEGVQKSLSRTDPKFYLTHVFLQILDLASKDSSQVR